MNYPIFNSIVNQIESRLTRRNIFIDHFRLWNEEKINATGLEISINLNRRSELVKKLVINLDWDKFREASLARQLSGMEKHPLLQTDAFSSKNITPHIDVETNWFFDEQVLYRKLDSQIGNRRIEAARHWMKFINQELRVIDTDENLMTRWHMEIEGDIEGRYVTNMSLISYLQYNLEMFTYLNDIHSHVEKNIQIILQRTSAVLKIASKTMEEAA